jgi:predicted RNA-binding Zn-ribbon protein involved in translation (DUF1610 family)
MGKYSEYIESMTDFPRITAERKEQLKKIAAIRGREILVYASDISNKNKADTGINFADITPFKDQLSNIKGDDVDIILETPGGLAEIVEDLVHLLRSRFNSLGILIPGTAKSAGTIFAMAGDEILMGISSTLGPIDAQVISPNGKRFSADAFLDGLTEIKKEVDETKKLNPAYIPILQNISPGEIQFCKNAQEFSRTLVTNWLSTYKFKFWTTHSSTGQPVTENDKKERANDIAAKLCKHSDWLTHGRSIRMNDLHGMKLKITNYEEDEKLKDAIERYYILLRLTFDRTTIFKIYETISTQIYSSVNVNPTLPMPMLPPGHQEPKSVIAGFECPKCGLPLEVQLDLATNQPLKPGVPRYPKNNIYICPNCGSQQDLTPLKLQVEAQSRKKVII